MRKNPHVRICGGLGSATTLVYPTSTPRRSRLELAGSSGVRHSVSTKILTEPPAVRMVSTFPLAIQL